MHTYLIFYTTGDEPKKTMMRVQGDDAKQAALRAHNFLRKKHGTAFKISPELMQILWSVGFEQVIAEQSITGIENEDDLTALMIEMRNMIATTFEKRGLDLGCLIGPELNLITYRRVALEKETG